MTDTKEINSQKKFSEDDFKEIYSKANIILKLCDQVEKGKISTEDFGKELITQVPCIDKIKHLYELKEHQR